MADDTTPPVEQCKRDGDVCQRKLLNFSTHPGDPGLFGDDWTSVEAFLHQWQFDGFELLPVGNYDFEKIPPRLIQGLHLRFFIFLREIWEGRSKALLDIFGSWENVDHFYGGRTRDTIVTAYAQQFDLAEQLGAEYVVFHPVHCELAHIYDWKFPYHWQETLDLCSEILNESLAESNYSGLLLFENLWWPGSFRLEDTGEYDYLRKRVNYERCGIVLDTAHLLSSCGGFDDEKKAIAHLLKKVDAMGALRREIRTVHLTSSLSGSYIQQSRANGSPLHEVTSFRKKFELARKHVSKIDPHEPFTHPDIAKLFDLIEPDNVVFEFTFTSIDVWQDKIRRQKNALQKRLWP